MIQSSLKSDHDAYILSKLLAIKFHQKNNSAILTDLFNKLNDQIYDNIPEFVYTKNGSSLLAKVYSRSPESNQVIIMQKVLDYRKPGDLLTNLPYEFGNILKKDLSEFLKTSTVAADFRKKNTIDLHTLERYGASKLAVIYLNSKHSDQKK